MRASEAVVFHRSRIRQIALSHRVSEVRVFGSAARGEDTDSSDIDFLVEPTDETTLLDLGAIRAELKALLGREVDVLTPGALPESFRAKVMSEARLV
jgi:predicted nucleotidyltransferase